MAYSAQADIEAAVGGAAKLIELIDYDADGLVDSAELTKHIEAADEFVDSYAQRRYNVPFTAVPPIIKRFAVEETVYRLKLARTALTERDVAEREERIAWLTDLAKGVVSVGSDPEPAASAAHVAEAQLHRNDDETEVDEGRTVTRQSLEGLW